MVALKLQIYRSLSPSNRRVAMSTTFCAIDSEASICSITLQHNKVRWKKEIGKKGGNREEDRRSMAENEVQEGIKKK